MLTPEKLVYDLRGAADPQVSPDGRQVTYAVGAADRETKKTSSQLWLADIDGGNARQVTWTGQRNRGARWSPDGTRLAFVSDRVEKSGLFVMPIGDLGEPRELARHGADVLDIAWSPDGTRIAYSVQIDPENPEGTERPKDAAPPVRATRRLDYKRDTRGWLGEARRQVFVVDVASGDRRQVTSETLDHNSPQWSPDGRWLAMQLSTARVLSSLLELMNLETGERRVVGDADGVATTWAWSPRGDRVLFSGEGAEFTAQPDYWLYTLATGETRRVTDDLPILPNAGFAGLLPPCQPIWLDERTALIDATRAGASGLYTIDVESGALELVHEAPAARTGLSTDRAHRYAAQVHASADALGEIAVYDRETKQERIITRQSAEVMADPPSYERIEVRRGDFAIEAWVLRPHDFDPSKKYPVILDVHGGPQGFYGYGFSANQLLLASNGYLVVCPNPRGSSSYGRRFTIQVIRDWGGEDYLDLLAVLDAVLEKPYADRERTGIYGYSYGGYMTAWMLGQTDRFKAAVCGAPCFDLVSMYGTSDIGFGWGKHQWGGAPHEVPEWYAAHSPHTFAHRTRTPTLIIHGEADDRCPIGQGEEMFVALSQAGCEVEFVRYPGGSHLFQRTGPPEHREDVLRRVLDWFNTHL